MTSEERREARYRRRAIKRHEKKIEASADHDNYQKVFSYGNLYKAYRCCGRNVAWKASVQRYITQAPIRVEKTYRDLMSGRWRSKGFFEFDVRERGKTRHIQSVTIDERVVQRCLCDNALVPVLSRSLIHDNGASLKDKGYSFTVRRLEQHLEEHIRKHGPNGYVLLFDFRKFFNSIPHEVCSKAIRKAFSDERIINLTEHFIGMFGDRGLGLGSQISQVFALAAANRLDHFIKEICRIRAYGRYMDDGYLIHKDPDVLRKALDGIRRVCGELGLTLNADKTRIVPLRRGFTFLKIRFQITGTGRIIRKMPKSSITRMRRKLKSYSRLMRNGKMAWRDIQASWQSWKSYALKFDSYHAVRNMTWLYNELFVCQNRQI